MKTKLILAAILATAVVTALTAIHTSPATGQESGRDRAKLRSQLAALRAEVELLEIEHDALAENLKESMKSDIANSGAEAVIKEHPDLFPSPKAALSDEVRQMANEELNADKAISRAMGAAIARMKPQFQRLCGKLNEKRLDLDDLEALYAKSK